METMDFGGGDIQSRRRQLRYSYGLAPTGSALVVVAGEDLAVVAMADTSSSNAPVADCQEERLGFHEP